MPARRATSPSPRARELLHHPYSIICSFSRQVPAHHVSTTSPVQLAAARRYKSQIDADRGPGTPYASKRWNTAEAWQSLLGYLGSCAAQVRVNGGEIRVRERDDETVSRIDPKE